MLKHLMPKLEFPCKISGCRGAAKTVGVGNTRVMIGYSTGMPNCAQYSIFAHRCGRSIQDELQRFAHGRYEMAHKQYLSLTLHGP